MNVPTNLPDWPHFILQSMADGVITVNGEMQIIDLNRAAEKVTGYGREEAFRPFCGEISPEQYVRPGMPLKAGYEWRRGGLSGSGTEKSPWS